jgi:hypothetical protein
LLALVAAASLSGCFWWSGEWSSSQSHRDDPFSDGGPWVVLAILPAPAVTSDSAAVPASAAGRTVTPQDRHEQVQQA